MKLWLIMQCEVRGYDTYDSAVVAATTEDKAKEIHPNITSGWDHSGSWANSPNDVEVEYLGSAKKGTKEGVICASFNAG